MRIYDILEQKRRGEEHSREQLEFFINGFVSGNIPDYQAAAWLMAVCCNGMTDRETATLTEIMAASGDSVDLSRFGERSVDKHSTGGVGDKTSLIVAPIVACCGGKVAKMSGRGLGHTGGTIDKLESVPNFRTELSSDEFFETVEKTGMAIIGQTGNIAPADKKLYALRDVTATVESIPLITSSIMSKKLAAGALSLVLDVKVGSGAFMKTEAQARVLAQSMVNIGKRLGRNVTAVLTDMDTPLGSAIGNSLEVAEAISVLKGECRGDLYEVCILLAAEMLSLCLGVDTAKAHEMAQEAVSSGKALSKMREWMAAQGADVRYIDDPSLFKRAEYVRELKAEEDGYIASMETARIGAASVSLGAGRVKKTDVIDPAAGIVLSAKTGDKVKKGDTLCTLYTSSPDRADEAERIFRGAVTLAPQPTTRPPLIYGIIK